MEADDARQQREVAMLEQAEADLADVELALRRLDEGSYGRCEACGAPIDDDHLAANPAARRCAAHQPPTAT